MSDPGAQTKQQQGAEDDDQAQILLLAKHPGTGRYTSFNVSHLNAGDPEVASKLSYLNGDED